MSPLTQPVLAAFTERTPAVPDPSRPLSSRRRELLRAAAEVVSEQGLRGLTHRAVDRAAGLPQGSCSAYYRTRNALQLALGEYVADALSADVTELAAQLQDCAPEGDRAITLTSTMFEQWLSERVLLLSRVELSLEAARDPELATLLGRWHVHLVEVVDAVMAARNPAHTALRAEVLVTALDGVLIGGLVRPPEDRTRFVQDSLTLLITGLAEPVPPGSAP